MVDAEDDGITAALILKRDDREVRFACHPADAIALATMAAAPIYASGAAMDHSCPLGPCAILPINASAAARWLERVRPEDFAPDQ